MKKLIIILLTVCLLFVGCSNPNTYKYPKDMTNQDCDNNYSALSINYRYNRAYENGIKGTPSLGQGALLGRFFALYDVPIDQFILCIGNMFGDLQTKSIVYVSNSLNVDPIVDYTIRNVELFWSNEEPGLINNDDPSRFFNYADAVYVSSAAIVEKPKWGKELANNISDEINWISDWNMWETKVPLENTPAIVADYRLYNSDQKHLRIKISFDEIEQINWQSEVFKYEGEYYLPLSNGYMFNSWEYLVHVPDELSELIDEVMLNTNNANE